jgi:hypothetical protein
MLPGRRARAIGPQGGCGWPVGRTCERVESKAPRPQRDSALEGARGPLGLRLPLRCHHAKTDFSSVTSMFGSVHCASQVVMRVPKRRMPSSSRGVRLCTHPRPCCCHSFAAAAGGPVLHCRRNALTLRPALSASTRAPSCACAAAPTPLRPAPRCTMAAPTTAVGAPPAPLKRNGRARAARLPGVRPAAGRRALCQPHCPATARRGGALARVCAHPRPADPRIVRARLLRGSLAAAPLITARPRRRTPAFHQYDPP